MTEDNTPQQWPPCYTIEVVGRYASDVIKGLPDFVKRLEMGDKKITMLVVGKQDVVPRAVAIHSKESVLSLTPKGREAVRSLAYLVNTQRHIGLRYLIVYGRKPEFITKHARDMADVVIELKDYGYEIRVAR